MPVATEKPVENTSERLREYCANRITTANIDEANGVLKGCKIIGMVSANGRRYTPTCLTKATPLYESRPCYVNHDRDGGSRSYTERVGVWKNIVVGNEGLYGDLHLRKKHPLYEQILEDARASDSSVGFSHDAQGRTTKRDGETLVEEIHSVRSVDLVCDPATNKNFWESEDRIDESKRTLSEATSATLDQSRAVINDLAMDVKATRGRLLELSSQWRSDLCEGEISDEMAKTEHYDKMRKIHRCADSQICQAMYDDQNYPDCEAKHKRILSVLADWKGEMKKMPIAGATKESSMELKDLTAEQLRESRPDLVDKLTGNDDASKQTKALKEATDAAKAKDDEIKNLKEQVEKAKLKEAQAKKIAEIADQLSAADLDPKDKDQVSDVFMEQLVAATDAAARTKLIEDRKTLLSRVSRSDDEYHAKTYRANSPYGIVEDEATKTADKGTFKRGRKLQEAVEGWR